MKVKKIQIWSVLQGRVHPSLSSEEQQIKAFMPILQTLFPGMNYYSTSGFNLAVQICGQPVLRKLFPGLEDIREECVPPNDEVEIQPFLPSKGYDWYKREWRNKMKELIAAYVASPLTLKEEDIIVSRNFSEGESDDYHKNHFVTGISDNRSGSTDS